MRLLVLLSLFTMVCLCAGCNGTARQTPVPRPTAQTSPDVAALERSNAALATTVADSKAHLASLDQQIAALMADRKAEAANLPVLRREEDARTCYWIAGVLYLIAGLCIVARFIPILSEALGSTFVSIGAGVAALATVILWIGQHILLAEWLGAATAIGVLVYLVHVVWEALGTHQSVSDAYRQIATDAQAELAKVRAALASAATAVEKRL